jgi:hypothetical protein
MPELTRSITSPYVHSRVDSNTFTMGNSMPESTLTLFHSRLYPQSGNGLGIWILCIHNYADSSTHITVISTVCEIKDFIQN